MRLVIESCKHRHGAVGVGIRPWLPGESEDKIAGERTGALGSEDVCEE